MKSELYEEVELIRSVPDADLKVGDFSESLRSNRAILIDYLEHPGGGELGAVLELSQSLVREQYVVTVPVGAISPKACEVIAPSDSTAHAVAMSQAAVADVPVWLSFFRRILNVLAKFAAFRGWDSRKR